jgi:hypothetical protein
MFFRKIPIDNRAMHKGNRPNKAAYGSHKTRVVGEQQKKL